MKKNSMAGRIVKNVNRVLEVIPRTISKDAEVIKLDFKKPRKARRSTRTAKKSTSKGRVLPMKSRSSSSSRSRKSMPATSRAKRAVKSTARGVKRRLSARKGSVRARSAKNKTARRPVARAA